MFVKATKAKSKLRLAIMGVSGAGKTMTALRIATGLGGKIAFIDTERGSASKYSDRFEFDVCELRDYSIKSYVDAIQGATGYDVLVIDSLTHAWQELLQEVDKLAQTKYRGNTWSAWSQGTPMQQKLINAILNFDGHVIATMRTRTEWVIESNSNGKNAPKKVGTNAEQGKGIEYEFDMLIEITQEHVATVTKDRTGKYQDKIIEKPGEELGIELKKWLNEGVDAPKKKVLSTPDDVKFDLELCQTKEDAVKLYKSLAPELQAQCRDIFSDNAIKMGWKEKPVEKIPEEEIKGIEDKFRSAVSSEVRSLERDYP
jgi:hypothetical protein